MKRTRIISAFAGCGKTYFTKHTEYNTLDLDSSEFEKDENFPQNYINKIKQNIGIYDFILISTHKEVRQVLKDNCLYYYLIYPDIDRKEEFIERLKNCGSTKDLIDKISNNWETWIRDLSFDEHGCSNIRMILPNLENEINHIICSENGDMIDLR